MTGFRVQGLPEWIAAEVRETRTSPIFGHPAVAEVATGTGPCRSCLGLFEVGTEERLLFTYRPESGDGTTGAPGPVYIHGSECERWDADALPSALLELPLLFEGRTSNGTIVASLQTTGDDVGDVIERLLGLEEVEFLFLRHGEAGCHIARLDRA